MSKKILISCLILIIMMLTVITNMSYAANQKVTKEMLTQAFTDLIESVENSTVKITAQVQDKIITISQDSDTYMLQYDLTDKPTFTYEMVINESTSYDDFKEELSGSLVTLPSLGYMATAKALGVEFEDSTAYYEWSILSNLSDSNIEGEVDDDAYIIVPDNTNVEDTENDKIIKESEFGKYAVKYVHSLYGNGISCDDKDEFDTYTWTMKCEDISETSCKLVSKMIVNTDADFTQLDGYYELSSERDPTPSPSISPSTTPSTRPSTSPSTRPDRTNTIPITNTIPGLSSGSDSQSYNDDTIYTTTDSLPKAGAKGIIIVGIATAVIIAITFGIKVKKYKDVK